MNKKERGLCEFEIGFKKFFVGVPVSAFIGICCVLWVPSGLKTGVENYIFGLKQGQYLEKRAVHPNQEFPGVPPDLDGQL